MTLNPKFFYLNKKKFFFFKFYFFMNNTYVINSKSIEKSMVLKGCFRITILTERCFRIEYNQKKQFLDLPTSTIINRNIEDTNFIVSNGFLLEIRTKYLILTLKDFEKFPNFENLQIKSINNFFNWNFLEEPKKELFGSYRTLDCVSGSIPLGKGLISQDGFSFFDDSKSPIMLENGLFQNNNSELDIYFFGYEHEYNLCIKDFLNMSGKPPLLPKYSLGIWWSRYFAYKSEEMLEIVQSFKDHEVPLSVYVIDMDWHIVNNTGNKSNGWTGYTFNKELIPNPEELLNKLHNENLAITLNLHPADGVWPHEDQYSKMVEEMNIKDLSQIPFNIENEKFMNCYFKYLHHPLENLGVDFWWIDWQQGTGVNIDPLIGLNHLHFLDNSKDLKKRPLILSRWCGLGGQRYPIGFSGDTTVEWKSLQFQPYFTSTSSNVGFGFWSHDIGGHYSGIESGELLTRWIQFGTLSPILRLHSNCNPFHERLPWNYDKETEFNSINALKLRNSLIPFLYSVFYLYSFKLINPFRPMYYLYPDNENSYRCPWQYFIGNDLIACPIITPIDFETGFSESIVWLPPNHIWYDFQTGREYQPGWHSIHGSLSTIPIFLKGGSILPLIENNNLIFNIFLNGSTTFQFYQDDNISQNYKNNSFFIMEISTLNQSKNNFQIQFNSIGDLELNKYTNFYIKIRNINFNSKFNTNNCKLLNKKIINDDILLNIDIINFPFLIEIHNENDLLIDKSKISKKEIFNFINKFQINTFLKKNLFNEIIDESFNLNNLISFLQIPEKFKLFLINEIYDFGWFKVISNLGNEDLIIWNNNNISDFKYYYQQINMRNNPKINKIKGIVPKDLVFQKLNEQTKNHDHFNIPIRITNLELRISSFYFFKINFYLK